MNSNKSLAPVLTALLALPLSATAALDFSNMTEQDAVRAAHELCNLDGMSSFDMETCLDEQIALITKRIALQSKFIEAIRLQNERSLQQGSSRAISPQVAPQSGLQNDLYVENIVGRIGQLRAGIYIRGQRFDLAVGESAKGYRVDKITRDFVLVSSLENPSAPPIKLSVVSTLD
jgi:hypothetical protein